MQNCKKCKKEFEILDSENEFYKKIDVPAPEFCGACRQTSLMVWRNERTFYNRKCEKCGVAVVAIFSPATPYKVICNECWWSNDFDPLAYGRDFDFSRPFFEQFDELVKSVPMGNLFIANSENSTYSNFSVGNKNCYICIASDYNEDSFYLDSSNHNRNVCDVTFVNKGELCYEGVDLERCYNCHYSQNLKDCNECFACSDLSGCQNCIGSVGLRNASYRIFNRQYTKEDYLKEVAKMQLGSWGGVQKVVQELKKIKLQAPIKYSNIINSVDSTGNYLFGCKNCVDCYDMHESQDCTNAVHGYKSKDCHDSYGTPSQEIAFNSVATPENYNIICSVLVWPGSSDVFYSLVIRTAKNCFGCVSLHNNEYCILNKKYSKEEYEKLKARIIEHMKSTGEWGKFFPSNMSPWSYNETIANDFNPKTKEQALEFGANWADDTGGTRGKETLKQQDMPEDIKDASEDLLKEVLACAECSRNYKIIKQELAFYKKLNLPLPRKCGVCRYRARIALRNPRKLWHRKCANCTNEFETTYAPERPEKILCAECYNKEVI